MSVKVMSRVWDFGPPVHSDRFVLLAIADYCNDDGECWPSIRSICGKVCMSERGVQTVIRRLEANGWLEIKTGNGRKGCNQYTVKTPQEMHPAGNAPPQMDAKTPQMDAQNPAPRAPEPSGTIKEPSVKGRAREILAFAVGEKVADDFIAHRKAMKKPLTDRAAELIVSQLVGCRDPVAAINQSIMNGWQGVFPKRDTGGKNDGAAADRARRAGERYAERHGSRDVDFGPDRNTSQPLLPAR